MDTDTQYQYTDPYNNRKKKKIFIILATVIILGAIVAITLALSGSSDQSSSSEEQVGTTAETCIDETCFAEKYFSCQPAAYEAAEEQVEIIIYEILEPTETGCRISLEYISSSSEELIGKGMICNFENEVGFRPATSLVLSYPQDYVCEGALADYLQS